MKKILVVDDVLVNVQLLNTYLTAEGYQVVSANDGEKALTAARSEKPDLILLDLMMPDIDGWEVYRQMKADPNLAGIPVIVVTAKAQSIDKVLGLHIAKVEDYVTKPFGPQELLASITKVLGDSSG